MTIEAIKHYEAALLAAFPRGATGDVFDHWNKARQAIEAAEKQEPVGWKNAAIRLGEELSSVGPDGYYNMTAEQWLNWAINQQPCGKNSLLQPKREWVGLTDEEWVNALGKVREQLDGDVFGGFYRAIEQALKEKNT